MGAIDYEKMYHSGRMTWQDAYENKPCFTGRALVFVRKNDVLGTIEYIDIDYHHSGKWNGYKGGEIKFWMPLPEFPNIPQTAEQIANAELHNAMRIAQIRDVMNNSSIQNEIDSPL